VRGGVAVPLTSGSSAVLCCTIRNVGSGAKSALERKHAFSTSHFFSVDLFEPP